MYMNQILVTEVINESWPDTGQTTLHGDKVKVFFTIGVTKYAFSEFIPY